MARYLVIVESPAKAKTLKKYLGKEFEILASYGHVRDLIPKKGAVDPERQFAMTYQLIEKNKKHVLAITKAAKQAEALYLATDPDREGEAISWHIYEILKRKKAMKDKPVHRITFHEITKPAVQHAIANPKSLAMELIHAQQARRALDYLVGFNLSPLLWKKVRRGLSAGRVQSPALRLIVERELEIEAFKSQEYWTLHAHLNLPHKSITPLEAKLVQYKGESLKQFSVVSETEATQIKAHLLSIAQGILTVLAVDKKQRKKQPAAPFTTATLQQEAAHKLGFTASNTMRTAQQLYEGLEVEGGPMGLITYMRTDSVHLAQEAVHTIREWIKNRYGVDAIPTEARQYQTKSKNAQEAHEAIRPTHIELLPEQLKSVLSPEQFKLYDLIWKRSVASQMNHATLEVRGIDFNDIEGNRYRATGTTVIEPGFMTVYQETEDAQEEGHISTKGTQASRLLPPLEVGAQIPLLDILTTQHFTEPPPRYNEASLIKTLEMHGIGRPSTYVPIIATLQQREYVLLEQKRFKPTDVGRIVNQFLTSYFNQYVDYNFTAQLEDELDGIARGEKNWKPILKGFWSPFKGLIDHTDKTVQRQEVTQQILDELCPKCQSPLSSRLGKLGRFIGCSAYPTCDYTRNVEESSTPSEENTILDRNCPECSQGLRIKQGRYGQFIGCSQYPKCKYIESANKPVDTGIACPECQAGNLLQRKSRYAKIFYSCATYPTCQYAIWNEPISRPCPKCAWPILTIKTTKRKGTEHVCPRKTCAYSEGIE